MRPVAVIAAFDEAATIGSVVRGLRDAGLPVIVVDDGSSDTTAARAAEAGARVLRHESNRGKGAALRSGFREAQARGYDAVLTLDGDLQHDPRDAPRFLEAAEKTGADLVLGTRMARPGGMPFHRRVTNALMSIVLVILTGVRMSDTQCGYRLLGRRALAALGLRCNRFDVDSEIVLEAAAAHLTIREVCVHAVYLPGRPSRIRPGRDAVNFFRLLFRFLARRGRFCPAGGLTKRVAAPDTPCPPTDIDCHPGRAVSHPGWSRMS